MPTILPDVKPDNICFDVGANTAEVEGQLNSTKVKIKGYIVLGGQRLPVLLSKPLQHQTVELKLNYTSLF